MNLNGTLTSARAAAPGTPVVVVRPRVCAP